MRKGKLSILFICILVAALGLFTSCGGGNDTAETDTQETQEAQETKVLGDIEIQDIAFADAGYDISAGSDIKMSAEVTSGTRNITFKIGDAEYSYDIDVNTGEIVNSVKPETPSDTPADPVEAAMNEVEKLPEFAGSSNIDVKTDGSTVTIKFDNGGESYEYKYDVASGKLEKQ